MKRLLHTIILIVSIFLVSCKQEKLKPLSEVVHLDLEWTFSESEKNQWLPANVPGTVHTDLLNNGKIPDPFYGCNEKDLQWIGERDWIYKTVFEAGSQLLKNYNINLVFEGLDTYASVFLNGKEVITANNMHRSWVVPCKNILVEGENTLELHFKSALNQFFEDSLALGYPLPGGRWVFARKAAYHFGWDWGPRFITAGIYKPVYLEVWNNHRPLDVHLFTKEIKNNSATLSVDKTVESQTSEKATVRVSDKDSGKVFFNKKVDLKEGVNNISFDFQIKNPKLWWSNGLGEPHIYELSVELETESGYGYAKHIPYGIKTLRTIMEPDEHGKALYVELNGHRVFVKGANYIPQHSFLSEVTDQDYHDIIDMAVESNMNMLRVWGGGIYEKDIFYELCNRNGLMVWQDFMFACAMYPGDDDFVENVRQEATQQVKRLRNYSNIALWCGNNEVDEGWHNWGWQGVHNISEIDSTSIWEGYKKVFHQLLPEVVSEHDPTRFYLSTSPLYGWGREKSMTHGSSHYWGVWWGVQPAEMYLDKVPRLMSEYGLQALPALSTIRAFQAEDEDYLFSASLKCHQKHPTGFENIAAYLEMENLSATSLQDLIYKSQLVQAKGIGLAIEAHRRSMPYCMGTLYWQLNDCWPVTSWSATDVFGNWKALQYKVRDLFDDIMVSLTNNKGNIEAFVVSDRLNNTKGKFELNIIDFSGKKTNIFSEEIILLANSSQKVISEKTDDFLSGIEIEKLLFEAVFTDETGKVYPNQKFMVRFGDVKLPNAHVKRSIEPTKGGYNITLKTDSLAAFVHLFLTESHARFSNNFLHLLPKQGLTVFCKTNLNLEDFSRQLKVQLLNENTSQNIK